jgi:hypothetical protein
VTRLICHTCRTTREVGDTVAEVNACLCCGAAMALVDPAAADATILQVPVAIPRPTGAWRTIRRELLIGLAWGLAIAGFVIYPLRVAPAYRGEDSRIHAYPPGVVRDAAGGRVYPPGASALRTGEWLALLAGECGTVVAVAGGIGVVVGVGKWLRGPR